MISMHAAGPRNTVNECHIRIRTHKYLIPRQRGLRREIREGHAIEYPYSLVLGKLALFLSSAPSETKGAWQVITYEMHDRSDRKVTVEDTWHISDRICND